MDELLKYLSVETWKVLYHGGPSWLVLWNLRIKGAGGGHANKNYGITGYHKVALMPYRGIMKAKGH